MGSGRSGDQREVGRLTPVLLLVAMLDWHLATFFAAAEELDVPILLHPNGFTGGERFRKYYFTNVMGNPLDTETILESVSKTGKAMVVYEDNKFLGVGAEVSAQIAEHALFDLDGPVVRIAGPHVPAMPFAPTLEGWFLPDPDQIEQEMRKLAEF